MEPIVVVGAANAEKIIRLREPFQLGRKHIVESCFTLAGGSCINYACRLLSMGIPVIPVACVGDDELGKQIVQTLRGNAQRGRVDLCEDFIAYAGNTSVSTILVDSQGHRTIITELGDSASAYTAYLEECLRDKPWRTAVAVVIGHIRGGRGDLTRRLIRHFAGRARICVNLGSTQYRLGPGAFLDVLNEVDYMQFHLTEAREFLKTEYGTTSHLEPSFEKMIEWFLEKTKIAAITLDNVGAVICSSDYLQNNLLIAWPYDLTEIIVDSTGAGDAFAAGFASTLASDNELNYGQIVNAALVARDWAAFACLSLGGADDCPTPERLNSFVEENRERTLGEVNTLKWAQARIFLRVFDLTYSAISPSLTSLENALTSL